MQEIKTIESFQCPKSPDKLCEDVLVVCRNFVAVIDGATAKGRLTWNGKTAGRMAAETIGAVVRALPAYAVAANFLCAANDAIRRVYEQFGRLDVAERKPEERLTASVVVYSAMRHEIWCIGDCAFRIDGVNHRREKPADAQMARIRADVNRYLLAHGHTADELQRHDTGRAMIIDALREQQHFQNAAEKCEYTFSVVDGFGRTLPDDACIPVREGAEVVLASDGYPELFGTLAESEENLQRLLRDDPLCIYENVQTKGLCAGNNSFDDRTYVRFLA